MAGGDEDMPLSRGMETDDDALHAYYERGMERERRLGGRRLAARAALPSHRPGRTGTRCGSARGSSGRTGLCSPPRSRDGRELTGFGPHLIAIGIGIGIG
jgi:hypothetical protein